MKLSLSQFTVIFAAAAVCSVAQGQQRPQLGRRGSSSSIMRDGVMIREIQHQHQEPPRRNLQSGGDSSSYKKIWDYTPQTKTTDYAAIDLDLKVVRELLANDDFVTAQKIYKEGGHVQSTAILELETVLQQDIPQGTPAVIPTGISDSMGWGQLYVDAKQGDKILFVEYATTANQDNFVGCQVGALPEPKTSGCFVESGTVNFPDLPGSVNYEYTYSKLQENINLRTLLTLSMNAHNFIENDTFQKYLDYYGSALYTDEITSAAFDGSQTGFDNAIMNFAIFGNKGNKELVEMSIVLLTVWMTVVGTMETAIHKCQVGTCETEICPEPPGVQEWDSAVAYYAGSALVDPATTLGNLLFAYADLRCQDMKTCGTTGNLRQGTSLMNVYIFREFQRGQQHLVEGRCDLADTAKKQILQLMQVPLIQGAIRYAHMVEGEMKLGDIEKHDAEAAGYALAVLPLVHACSPEDAQIIYNNLKPKSPTSVKFEEVKSAFERNYNCMNVKCSHVGGIYDDKTGEWKVGAEPCNNVMVGMSESAQKWTIALGVAFGGILIFAIIVCIVGRTERSMPSLPKLPKRNQNSNDLQLEANEEAEMT